MTSEDLKRQLEVTQGGHVIPEAALESYATQLDHYERLLREAASRLTPEDEPAAFTAMLAIQAGPEHDDD